jgi:hypothetical protein
VSPEVLYDIGVYTLGNADHVFSGKTAARRLLFELGSRGLALGTGFGSAVAGVNITAD